MRATHATPTPSRETGRPALPCAWGCLGHCPTCQARDANLDLIGPAPLPSLVASATLL